MAKKRSTKGRERVIVAVECFRRERKERYERAAHVAGLNVSEWARRVLDKAAEEEIRRQQ